MTEQNIIGQDDTMEMNEDNSDYLTALCLVGIGAAVGAAATKGYSKVKDRLKSRRTKETAELEGDRKIIETTVVGE